MGINKAPMRLILLEDERIVKMPREVAVVRMIRPRGFVKIMFIIMRIERIVSERVL